MLQLNTRDDLVGILDTRMELYNVICMCIKTRSFKELIHLLMDINKIFSIFKR